MKKILFLTLVSMLFLGCAKESGKPSAKSDSKGKGGASSELKIGAILPLSGKYSVYGQSVLHGIECAAGVTDPCKKQPFVTLMVRDAGNYPEEAVDALTSLYESGALMVIGPLLSVSEPLLALKAKELKIPLISLAQAGGAENNGYLFRNLITASDEVDALVEHALGERGLKNFYVLYPSSKKGEEYYNLFKEKISNKGGNLVGKLSYLPNQVGFVDEFRKAFEENLAKVEDTKKIEAIFIPDSYWAVGRLASAIDLAEMSGVQLLGTSRWNNSRLIQEAGEFVEGAVFVDSFFLKSTDENTRTFVEEFKGAYNIDPTLLEALGYDSASLVISNLSEKKVFTRELALRILSHLSDFKGVTGKLKTSDDNRITRKLKLLTVRKGRIAEL